MRYLLCSLACVFATTALAQNEGRLDAARAYANTPVQQKLMDDMFSPEGIMAQMGLLGDKLTPTQQETVATVVSEELQTIRPIMLESLIVGMASNFTLEEITALTEFHSSSVGASAMSKMTPFMQQTMTAMAPEFQQMQVRLAQRLRTELSK